MAGTYYTYKFYPHPNKRLTIRIFSQKNPSNLLHTENTKTQIYVFGFSFCAASFFQEFSTCRHQVYFQKSDHLMLFISTKNVPHLIIPIFFIVIFSVHYLIVLPLKVISCIVYLFVKLVTDNVCKLKVLHYCRQGFHGLGGSQRGPEGPWPPNNSAMPASKVLKEVNNS